MQYKANPTFGASQIRADAPKSRRPMQDGSHRRHMRSGRHQPAFGSMVHDRSIGLGILAMYALFMGGGYWLGQHSPKRRKW